MKINIEMEGFHPENHVSIGHWSPNTNVESIVRMYKEMLNQNIKFKINKSLNASSLFNIIVDWSKMNTSDCKNLKEIESKYCKYRLFITNNMSDLINILLFLDLKKMGLVEHFME